MVEPKAIPACGLCEKEIVDGDLYTSALANATRNARTYLLNIPVHFSCFAQLIAGEVAQAVDARGSSIPELDYEGESDLNGALRKITHRLIDEFLE